jgi:hypothetical protein
MKKQYIFKCPVTKYFIEYIIDTDLECAYINTIYTDHLNMKAFLAILRKSIDQLSELNVKTIRQTVYCKEWKLYLKNKTSWRIINTDQQTNSHDIECNIQDFLHNYAIGIGIEN